MDYIELNCKILPLEQGREIMIAHLADAGFESFVETDEGVQAYIPANKYNDDDEQNCI